VLLANVLLVQSWLPRTLVTGIGPAWSLGAEVAFYAVLPLLVLLSVLLVRRGSRVAAVLLGPLVLAVTGWVVTVVLDDETAHLSGQAASDFLWGHQWSAVLARSLLGQADLFAYGMLVAVAVVLLGRRGVRRVPAVVPVGVAAAALALMWAALDGPIAHFGPTAHFERRFVGIGAALLLLAVVLPSPSGGANLLARALEVRPLRYVGLISYSVYLWHVPVLFWLDRHGLTFGRDGVSLVGNLVLVAAVTLALSSLTYAFVERPALRSKRPMTGRAAVPARDGG
jgi:peptidoglycan/LPS O-acetylase OafA/YrhL